MHTRMDSESSESKVLKSQLHRNARILRATTVHENRMRQIMSPASFYLSRHASVHQAVVNYGFAAYVCYPIPMMQKLARFRRMLALRAKRKGCHPPTEFRYGSIQQNNFPIIPMLLNRFDSNTGLTGGSGGGGIIASCDIEANHISPEGVEEVTPDVKHVTPVDKHISDPKQSYIEAEEKTVTQDDIETNHTSPAVEHFSPVEKHISDCKQSYIGVEEDDENESDKIVDEDEGLTDIWKEMEFAMETCRESPPEKQFPSEDEMEDEDDCDHSYILKDDVGYVCRVCGLVQKGIQDIFEFNYPKKTRAKSCYRSEPQNTKDNESAANTLPDWCKLLGMDEGVAEVLAHAQHIKQMKPHQMEGFNFLLRNLVTENPHGCILAHAPGSGKTFMIICFLHSYLTKYPSARPLVILPKGILGTWKKEFQRWELDDIPLHDFYSVKAVTRAQQLNVLKQWAEKKSVLFLGYKQFSSIVMGGYTSKEMTACKEILVRAPTVLILDEGHTPRNKNTDTLYSLTQVQTPKKVVLSGTLYQNHVQEVFNIVDLVQPRFLKLERNRAIVKRIMSKVDTHGVRKKLTGSGDAAFYDLVENTLINDENEKRKAGIIKDLREMTSHVLHYYKGDSFDELPGLVDLTVLLSLSAKQKDEVDEMKKVKERKFKSSSLGSAIYVHPQLKQLSGNNNESKVISDEKVDQMIENMNLKDGVKAMFFLNMIRLCDIAKEKLLVFSQYLLPLKFLERLAVHDKGWSMSKEMFMITGESTPEHREWSMEQFNSSPNARVFFGSIKACGEGISLVGASRVLILDVHPNPSVSWQAICRAFRPGQQKKVFTYRLVAADSPEEKDHSASCKKEFISKMWFEWDEYDKKKDLALESIDFEDCCDIFLENPLLRKDIKALYKR